MLIAMITHLLDIRNFGLYLHITFCLLIPLSVQKIGETTFRRPFH